MTVEHSDQPKYIELSDEELELLALILGDDDQQEAPIAPIELYQDGDWPPLSFGQERLWFLDQWDRGNPAYNLLFTLHITGPLDPAALGWSLDQLLARHAVLRTTFVLHHGQPRQHILPHLALSIAQLDLRALPAPERTTRLHQLARDAAATRFELERGPLLSATLVQLAPAEAVFLLCLHHIIFDGWSLALLTRELLAGYDAARAQRPLALPALPIQYADYARWQRQWLHGTELERQLRYWQQQLADLPLLALPTDFPRPLVRSTHGATRFVQIPAALLGPLKQLGQQQGATLFMTLLAAFQLLLHRVSGQDDIALGTPVAGRTRPETEGLIGFFVNTLVLRTDLSGQPSFRELLARVRQITLAALDHQDLPFDRLVEALQPERSLSHTPLFQAMFILQNTPLALFKQAGLTIRPLPTEITTAKFDLSLSIVEQAGGLTATLEYSTDLFTAATIERLLTQWQVLLAAIVATPDRPVATVPLLDPAQRIRLLQTWNQTQRPYPAHLTVPQLVAAQAARTPHAPALTDGTTQLSYAELDQRANQLAHTLRAHGVGAEVVVAVYLERSAALVVALLAVLKAGGAYLPLDLHAPAERLHFMLTDAHAALILAETPHHARLAAPTIPLLCLDQAASLIAQQPTTPPASAITAANLAYVIYTSGSTGQPKGVSIVHRAIARLVCNPEFVTLSPADRIAQISNIAFDAATFEIWGSLINGACLVLPPPAALSLEELGQFLVHAEITVLWLTAGLFHQMVAHNLAGLRTVRALLAGGDVLQLPQVRRVLDDLPHCTLINGYGPTENTTFTCCQPLSRSTSLGDSVPIGRPIANTQVYVLDAHAQPVPIGVAGELYTGGDGLARGYLGQPALTAERFVPDPFSGVAGARLYRTGDLVRYRDDGALEFLGRRDAQVKLRGFRVELGEIEAVLAQHAAVREVAVTATGVAADDKLLVAYVVSESAHASAALSDTLRAFLQQRVPDYMLPAAFVLLDRLPLTANGKLDRRALPAPQVNDRSGTATFVPASTALQHDLVALWQEVLEVAPIGIHDNFFALGGHSLLATRLINEARTRFAVDIPLQDFFSAPTVAQLAQHIHVAQWAAESSTIASDEVLSDEEEGEL